MTRFPQAVKLESRGPARFQPFIPGPAQPGRGRRAGAKHALRSCRATVRECIRDRRHEAGTAGASSPGLERRKCQRPRHSGTGCRAGARMRAVRKHSRFVARKKEKRAAAARFPPEQEGRQTRPEFSASIRASTPATIRSQRKPAKAKTSFRLPPNSRASDLRSKPRALK